MNNHLTRGQMIETLEEVMNDFALNRWYAPSLQDDLSQILQALKAESVRVPAQGNGGGMWTAKEMK